MGSNIKLPVHVAVAVLLVLCSTYVEGVCKDGYKVDPKDPSQCIGTYFFLSKFLTLLRKSSVTIVWLKDENMNKIYNGIFFQFHIIFFQKIVTNIITADDISALIRRP